MIRIKAGHKKYGRYVKEALNLVKGVRERGGRFLKERQGYYDVGDEEATAYTLRGCRKVINFLCIPFYLSYINTCSFTT